MNFLAWYIVFRTEISSKISLRGKLVSDVLLQAFKLVVPLLTWHSLYQGKNEIGGYSFSQMASYVLIMNFIGFIFTMAHGSEFAAAIKTGKLSTLLLRPIGIGNSFSAKFVARVLFNTILIIGPLFALHIVLNLEFGTKIYFLSLVLVGLNLLFCFLFGLLFGLSAFWLDEVWPLSHLVRSFIAIAGGLWFPLNLLPWGLGDILSCTPFSHLGYLNGAALLGTLTDTELLRWISQAVVWILLFALAYCFLLKRGISKYESVGA